MSTMNSKKNRRTYTVKEAASMFDRVPSRIRQICLEHDIGTSVEGRIRILSPADLEKIRKVIEETGRK